MYKNLVEEENCYTLWNTANLLRGNAFSTSQYKALHALNKRWPSLVNVYQYLNLIPICQMDHVALGDSVVLCWPADAILVSIVAQEEQDKDNSASSTFFPRFPKTKACRNHVVFDPCICPCDCPSKGKHPRKLWQPEEQTTTDVWQFNSDECNFKIHNTEKVQVVTTAPLNDVSKVDHPSTQKILMISSSEKEISAEQYKQNIGTSILPQLRDTSKTIPYLCLTNLC